MGIDVDVPKFRSMVATREELHKIIPKKKSELETLENIYNDLLKSKAALDLKEADAPQEQKAKIEEDKATLDIQFSQAVTRLRNGALYFRDKNNEIKETSNVITTCLRNDKNMIVDYFGELVTVDPAKIEKLLTDLPIIAAQPPPPVPEKKFSARPNQPLPPVPMHKLSETSQVTPVVTNALPLIDAIITSARVLEVAANEDKSLKGKVDALETELAQKKKMFDQNVREKVKLSKDLQTLKDENAKLKQDLEKAKKGAVSPRGPLSPRHTVSPPQAPINDPSKDKEIAALKEQVASLHTKLDQSEKHAAGLQSTLEQTKVSLESKYNDAVAAQKQAEHELQSAQAEVHVARKQSEIAIEKLAQDHEDSVKTLKDIIANQKGLLQHNLDAQKKMTARLEDQHAVMQNQDMEITKLQEQLKNAQKDEQPQPVLLSVSLPTDSQINTNNTTPPRAPTPPLPAAEPSRRTIIPSLMLTDAAKKNNLISNKIQMFEKTSKPTSTLLAGKTDKKSARKSVGDAADNVDTPTGEEPMVTAPVKAALELMVKHEREQTAKMKASYTVLMDELNALKQMLDEKNKAIEQLTGMSQK